MSGRNYPTSDTNCSAVPEIAQQQQQSSTVESYKVIAASHQHGTIWCFI